MLKIIYYLLRIIIKNYGLLLKLEFAATCSELSNHLEVRLNLLEFILSFHQFEMHLLIEIHNIVLSNLHIIIQIPLALESLTASSFTQ